MTRIDLIIHDAHHLCRRFRMHGKRAMSRGFSGGKHVLKFANRSNLLLSHQFLKRVQRWRVSWIGSTDEGFLQENVWPFCQAAKKSGRNSEVALRRGFTVFKCTLMIFMVFMIDVTFFQQGSNPKEKCVVRNYTLLRLIWSSACPSYAHFWTQVTQWRPMSNADVFVPFIKGRCHF